MPSQTAALPITIIRPPGGWMALNLRELWDYRELLYFFAWRDFKVRYKQALLGMAWAVIDPVVNTVVFAVIFGGLAKMQTDGLPPLMFYLTGLVIWKFFSSTVTLASNSLVVNANMLTKIYFPRLLLPVSTSGVGLVDFGVALCALGALLLFYGAAPAFSAVFCIAVLGLAWATAMGVSLLLAALNVRYRDVRNVVPFLVQVWMYISVIVPFSRLPERWGAWRYLYGLNPMAGIVEMFRWCFLHNHMQPPPVQQPLGGHIIPELAQPGQSFAVGVGQDLATSVSTFVPATGAVDPPLVLLAVGLPVTAGLLLLGLFYFRRVENQFADII
jgi:lipopolysaccharide transport system permease protein